MASVRIKGENLVLTMTAKEARYVVNVIDGALDAGAAWGGYVGEEYEALSDIEAKLGMKCADLEKQAKGGGR